MNHKPKPGNSFLLSFRCRTEIRQHQLLHKVRQCTGSSLTASLYSSLPLEAVPFCEHRKDVHQATLETLRGAGLLEQTPQSSCGTISPKLHPPGHGSQTVRRLTLEHNSHMSSKLLSQCQQKMVTTLESLSHRSKHGNRVECWKTSWKRDDIRRVSMPD